MKKFQNSKGFTLIELLIVIALIAIIAAVVFVALDPLTRFQDARDSRRWSDISAILSALKVDQVDNGGQYLSSVQSIPSASSSEVFMIVAGDVTSGCDDQNAYCDTAVTDDNNCINIYGLVTEGYLGSVPYSPNGSGTWTASTTGYTIQKKGQGNIVVRACESENSDEIEASR